MALKDLFKSKTEDASDLDTKVKKKRGKKSAEPLYINPDDDNAAEMLIGGGEKKKPNPLAGVISMKRIPLRVYALIMFVLLVLTLAGGLFVILRFRNIANAQVQERTAGKIFLDNTLPSSNAFNYIYTDTRVGPPEEGMSVKRMSFDDSSSVLYFNSPFDFKQYDIWLTDSFGRYLGLDPAFIEADGKTLFPENEVHFGALAYGSDGFTLYIKGLEDGTEYTQGFLFSNLHGLTHEKRTERVLTIRDTDGGLIGSVQGMALTSTGTHIFFTMNERNAGYQFDPAILKSNAALSARGKAILPLTSVRAHETADGSLLCRADYRPLSNLSGIAELTFSGLFKEIPINETVNTAPLYFNETNNTANYAVFEAGNYRVVLERVLSRSDGTYLLVLHSEDMNAVLEGPEDRSNRREVLIDSHLEFTMSNGDIAVIPPTKAYSKEEGSDITYELGNSPYADAIRQGRFTSVNIAVNSALVRIPDVSVKIDLDALREPADFEKNVLANYNRLNAGKDRYSVSVIAYEKEDNVHRALVRELWYEDGGARIVTTEIKGVADPYNVRVEEIEVENTTGLY